MKDLIYTALIALGCALPAEAQNMTVVTRDGQTHRFATADIEQVTFEAAAQQGPFEVTVTDVTQVSAKLSIVPEDPSQGYYFDVCRKSDFETYGVKTIVENYFQSVLGRFPELGIDGILQAALSYGADSDEVSGLPADTEMVCYAIAVNSEAKCVGEPSVAHFRTLPGGDPSECTFDISYTDLSANGLNVIVRPSDPTVRYWMGCYSAFDWPGDEAMAQAVKATIDEYVSSYGRPLEEVVEGVTFTGESYNYESGFEADKAYYIYVYAMDPQGNAEGPMFKKRFVTTVEDASDADLSLTYRYFNGDELAEAYPDRFSNAAGKVIVQPVFTPNEMTSNYVWAIAAGDYSDSAAYPDDATKQAVLNNGFFNVSTKNIYANWGKATFLYYASDQWGVDGKLNRTVADFTPEGASPAASYTDLDDSTSGQAATLKMSARKVSPENRRIWKRLGTANRVPMPLRNRF